MNGNFDANLDEFSRLDGEVTDDASIVVDYTIGFEMTGGGSNRQRETRNYV